MQWLRLAETAAARRDAFHRAAVEVRDDRVLRHVDEAARQVPRVGGLERGVREALTSAVGGDEVLEGCRPVNVRFAPRKRKFVSAARRYADEVD